MNDRAGVYLLCECDYVDVEKCSLLLAHLGCYLFHEGRGSCSDETTSKFNKSERRNHVQNISASFRTILSENKVLPDLAQRADRGELREREICCLKQQTFNNKENMRQSLLPKDTNLDHKLFSFAPDKHLSVFPRQTLSPR